MSKDPQDKRLAHHIILKSQDYGYSKYADTYALFLACHEVNRLETMLKEARFYLNYPEFEEGVQAFIKRLDREDLTHRLRLLHGQTGRPFREYAAVVRAEERHPSGRDLHPAEPESGAESDDESLDYYATTEGVIVCPNCDERAHRVVYTDGTSAEYCPHCKYRMED